MCIQLYIFQDSTYCYNISYFLKVNSIEIAKYLYNQLNYLVFKFFYPKFVDFHHLVKFYTNILLAVAKEQGGAITGRKKISFFIDVNTCFLNWDSCSALLLSKMQFKGCISLSPVEGTVGIHYGPTCHVCLRVPPPYWLQCLSKAVVFGWLCGTVNKLQGSIRGVFSLFTYFYCSLCTCKDSKTQQN